MIIEINYKRERKKEKQMICERMSRSPSQDCDPGVSGLYTITIKQLHTRVGNPCIDTLAHRDTQIDTETHADTDNANTPVCTDSFAVANLDPVCYAACQHIAEFL